MSACTSSRRRERTPVTQNELPLSGPSVEAQAHLATVLSLAEALDQRDSGTARHSETVGRLWFAERDVHGARHVYLYDITVAPSYRGQGRTLAPFGSIHKPR